MGVKVREKPKGSKVFWVFVNYNRKRVARSIGSAKAAFKVKEQVEARLKLGHDAFPEEENKSKPPTLAEYYEKFQRTYLSTAVSSSTKISYDGSFKRHILPEFGCRHLDEITKADVKEFIAKLVNKTTVRFNRPARRSALKKFQSRWAGQTLRARRLMRDYEMWIRSNPDSNTEAMRQYLGECIGTAFPDKDSIFRREAFDLILEHVTVRRMARPSIRIILAELAAVLNSAEVPALLQATLRCSPDYYPLFLCAIHTGVRSGELAGLQWGDIDWKGKFLTVRRNLVRGRIHRTKTEKIRRIDMSDALISELSNVRRQRREEWLSRGKNEIPDWVFCNREGNPIDLHNVKTRHFNRCLEKAGLRHIRFHDLRHTFASLLIQNGQSLKYVCDQLGHSSIKMTADVYGHLVPGANRQAMNSLPTLNATAAAEKAAAENA